MFGRKREFQYGERVFFVKKHEYLGLVVDSAIYSEELSRSGREFFSSPKGASNSLCTLGLSNIKVG